MVFCLANACPGQGLLINDEKYNQLPRQPLYGDGGKSESEALKGVSKVDLRPYCPQPKHQGKLASCTGWSTGYGAMSIAHAIKNKWEDDTDKITDSAFSALFLYNQVKEEGNCNQVGSHISDALALIQRTGNVLSEDFDEDPTDCERQPTAAELRLATQYRIKDFMTLFEFEDPSRVKIDKTKLSLAAKKPVIIGMRLRQNFIDLSARSKYWYPYLGDSSLLSMGHAMVVVGFDDGKGAFEVMNSWGEGWGKKGFFWIRYQDYADHCFYAFQFSLSGEDGKTVQARTEERPPELFGLIDIRVPNIVSYDSIEFQRPCLSHLGEGVYELCEQNWQVGKLYQLLAHDIKDGTYLYMFSYDSEEQINLHWPRDGALDSKFEGANESAIITNSFVELAIPGPKTALRLEKQGEEYLVMLISRSPIRNINSIIKTLEEQEGQSFVEGVRKALGKAGLKPEDTVFGQQAISFVNRGAGPEAVLPLFVRIKVN